MKTKCLIITGGNYYVPEESGAFDLIIAADKGLGYARRAGLVPDIVIGDFDSISASDINQKKAGIFTKNDSRPYAGRDGLSEMAVEAIAEETLYSFPEKPVRVIKLPEKKDDPDITAAARIALAEGMTDITICCAMGGRFDHMLSNLQTAAFIANHGSLCTIAGKNDVICVMKNTSLRFPRKDGWSLSLLALSDSCEGVSISGALYEAEDLVLTNQVPLGLSNRWAADAARVGVRKGVLAVVMSRM